MATIVTRAGKGSPLTNAEVDANFTNLNDQLATALFGANNLSDLANVSTARSNLGLAIGTNVQAWDADLDAIAALAGTSGLLKKTAANTWTLDTSTYLTGINSSQVTTALGFTPYNATNPSGYITSAGTSAACSGNAATATLATKASTLAAGGANGTAMTFNWSGQGGTPTWVWGGSDGSNMYVYSPANFTVGTATYLSATQQANVITGATASMAMSTDTSYRGSFTARSTGTGDANLAGMTFYNDNYAIKLGVRADGYFGLGGWSRAAWSWYSDPSGNMVAAGNVTAYSDERKKTNWRELPQDFIEQLALVKHGIYDRTDEELTQVGVSAQSLQRFMPQAVVTGIDGWLAVSYGPAAMVASVQLAKKYLSLLERVEQLEQKVLA